MAVLGASAMVVLAVVVRGHLDDDAGDSDGEPGGDDEVVLVCDPDLADACAAFGDEVTVRVEDSAATAAALADGSLDDVDGWVTSAAWLEVATARAERPPGEAAVAATSDVVLAVDALRADALRARCGDQPAWRCVGDDAEQPWADLGGDARWGPLRTGLPDADTAVGLSVLASVAAGHFDGTDFAANDFGELRGWLSRLAEPSGTGDRDLLTTLVRVRGTYSAGGLTSADASDRAELSVVPAEPVVGASAVLVDLAGGDDLPGIGPLRDALVAEGWDAGDGDAPAPLLKAGVMAALHTLWKDTTS
jgi:hypothetical protein